MFPSAEDFKQLRYSPARFGRRFGERNDLAVPLTEAQRDCVCHFVPRRARVKPQRNVRWRGIVSRWWI